MLRMLIVNLLKSLGKMLVSAGTTMLYNAIDEDRNGDLSRAEIIDFANKIKSKFSSIKNKVQ